MKSVRCPRCKHRIREHTYDFQRTWAACSGYRRDDTACDCTRIPTESELNRSASDPD